MLHKSLLLKFVSLRLKNSLPVNTITEFRSRFQLSSTHQGIEQEISSHSKGKS